MYPWNLADALDLIAGLRADSDSVLQAARRHAWREVERRAGSIAAWMKACGASHQGKVAIYSYNHPAYMESIYAAMKAALVPVNVNYRYRAAELRYLLQNADAEIAVVHEDFLPQLEEVRAEIPSMRGVLVVAERGAAALPPGAEDYESVASAGDPAPAVTRSPDDRLLLYTGGTTGMPKGVMWRQDDLYAR